MNHWKKTYSNGLGHVTEREDDRILSGLRGVEEQISKLTRGLENTNSLIRELLDGL